MLVAHREIFVPLLQTDNDQPHETPTRMKRIFCSAYLIGCVLMARSQGATFIAEIVNEGDVAMSDAPVVIALDDVDGLTFDVRSARVEADGESLPWQLDDMDGDGSADELAFLVDMDAHSTRAYVITLSTTAPDTAFTPRVYADMMLSDKRGKYPLITALETPGSSYVYSDLHHHGPAFESELTAYRIYFDHRQNIDIYGKRTRRLELADTHFYTTAEQLGQGYGNDVLWAGSSVGCGTLKLWNNGAPSDWNAVDKRRQRIVSAGPLRVVVDVEDVGVQLPDGPNTIRTRYTLYAGHRDVAVNISARCPLAAYTLCTGVQKVGDNPAYILRDDGIAASWGSDYPEQSSQANKDLFPPEAVGLAVYVPDASRGEACDADLNALYILASCPGKQLNYYLAFCADKEADGYHSAQEWFAAVDAWKQVVDNPLQVSLYPQ